MVGTFMGDVFSSFSPQNFCNKLLLYKLHNHSFIFVLFYVLYCFTVRSVLGSKPFQEKRVFLIILGSLCSIKLKKKIRIPGNLPSYHYWSDSFDLTPGAHKQCCGSAFLIVPVCRQENHCTLTSVCKTPSIDSGFYKDFIKSFRKQSCEAVINPAKP